MKTAFITGISRGIGQATALAFLQAGYRVLGTSTSGTSTIDHPHCQCFPLSLDNQWG